MSKHDQSYKMLFSHPEVVRDLLVGFIHDDWIKQLDMSSLEKANSEYVSEELLSRDNDILWGVKWGNDWIYVYILLEFQSTPNKWMAVRVLTYICLLYQDLLKNKRKNLTRHKKLPPVFPIVLYNGNEPWQAETTIQALIDTIDDENFQAYQPNFQYVFLDEQKHANNDLAEMRNLAAAIFNLEQSRSVDDIQEVVQHLVSWLKHPEQTSLSTSLATWIKRVLSPNRLDGVNLNDEVTQLEEVRLVLSERIQQWAQELRDENLQKGLEQGIQKGEHQGKRVFFREMLINRFGELPPWVEQQIAQANNEQLASWGRALFTADSLTKIFEVRH